MEWIQNINWLHAAQIAQGFGVFLIGLTATSFTVALIYALFWEGN